jgi:energy-coupling factor transporter ATP-binding protein EcfA2
MFDCLLQAQVIAVLREAPAVALTGPRQMGKTTLALAVGQAWPPPERRCTWTSNPSPTAPGWRSLSCTSPTTATSS